MVYYNYSKYNKLIKCKCGCGNERLKYDKKGREMIYIVGHRQRLGNSGQFKKGNSSWNKDIGGNCKLINCDKKHHSKGLCLYHYSKHHYKNNKEEIKNNIKEYRKNHPEVILRSSIKYLEKCGKIFNMNSMEYNWAINLWSKSVKKRDNYTCKICNFKGDTSTLNSHHILYKRYYPKLSLDIDNGATLCIDCHKFIHSLNT